MFALSNLKKQADNLIPFSAWSNKRPFIFVYICWLTSPFSQSSKSTFLDKKKFVILHNCIFIIYLFFIFLFCQITTIFCKIFANFIFSKFQFVAIIVLLTILSCFISIFVCELSYWFHLLLHYKRENWVVKFPVRRESTHIIRS